MKVFSSAINFLSLMVALNQPTPSILFSFQIEKIPELQQLTTPNIQQSPGITVLFPSPALYGKRVMNMTCNTAHTEVFTFEALCVFLRMSSVTLTPHHKLLSPPASCWSIWGSKWRDASTAPTSPVSICSSNFCFCMRSSQRCSQEHECWQEH